MCGAFDLRNNSELLPLEITEIGSSIIKKRNNSMASIGMVINNPNNKKAVNVTVRLKLLNKSKFIIHSQEINISSINPKSKTGFAVELYNDVEEMTNYDVSIVCDTFIDVLDNATIDYSACLVSEKVTNYSRTIKYNLMINNEDYVLDGYCYILLRDENGIITGGSSQWFNSLSKTNPVLLTFNIDPQINCAKSEVYPLFRN